MRLFALLLAGISVIMFSTCVKAENLISENAENWTGVKKVETAGEKDSIVLQAVAGVAVSKNMIPVDFRIKYRLSAKVKTPCGVQMFIGLIPYDSRKRQIMAEYFNVIKNSETTLAAPCKAEDRKLKVKNASKFRNGKTERIVFGADISGNYNDLPNFNLVKAKIVGKSKNKDGTWTIELEKTCGKNYPAGTVIRLHQGGAYYIYNAIKILPKGKWHDMIGETQGMCETKCEKNKFWPVTAYVKVVILNFVKRPFMFKDVILEEVK
jgi:hypothetical protein